ncbi:phiSA1p31-related protein [Streptomyces sp. NPDC048565]|uniref:phiSA1p31-related protein n=1 Tax=Streptomyces sp. NPDC048565 TaxID=3155266 RepID=UPI003424FC45
MTISTEIKATAEAAGCTFDLALTWIDADGSRWAWTGETDTTGMPLMQTEGHTPERLSQVYWMYGPLIAAPRPVTVAERRAALMAPICTSGDEQGEKATPTPRAFAALLGQLRGRSA